MIKFWLWLLKTGIGFYDSNFQHYAFAFHKNQLIEYGINYILNNQNIHAEHNLLSRLYKKHFIVKNISIYSIRLNKKGEIMNGQCCQNCIRRIKRAFEKNLPITHVCWSNQDGIIKKHTLSEAETICTHISKGDIAKKYKHRIS